MRSSAAVMSYHHQSSWFPVEDMLPKLNILTSPPGLIQCELGTPNELDVFSGDSALLTFPTLSDIHEKKFSPSEPRITKPTPGKIESP